MTMMNNLVARAISFDADRLAILSAAAFAALLGFAFLYGIGFAPMEVVHNAAHDARHALGFPCH
jgi:cobalt transporter subunit CbtB